MTQYSLCYVQYTIIDNISMIQDQDNHHTIRYVTLPTMIPDITYACTWRMHNLTPMMHLRETVLWLWRGNIDSVGHLCVRDAQLPRQDAWLESMTLDGM